MNIDDKPFVSICTPTFNRRPFIEYLIKCFNHQDYPKEKMEWIILDDGTDKIEDMVSYIPQVKYFYFDQKMVLGEKRNILNEKAKGDIIIYMDDDDYYPPSRVSHAVETLIANPNAMCAGSSIVHIYFKSLDKIYQFGPYGPKHATAATFAFRRELLIHNKYNDSDAVCEEYSFLNNYTVPFVQLDSFKTILVFAHEHNSVNKEMLLEDAHPDYIKCTDVKVEEFIDDADMRDFYVNRLGDVLKNYEKGRPEEKPEVLKQIEELKLERKLDLERRKLELNSNNNNEKITIKIGDEEPKALTAEEIVNILQQQHNYINQLNSLLKGKELEIDLLNKSLLHKNKL